VRAVPERAQARPRSRRQSLISKSGEDDELVLEVLAGSARSTFHDQECGGRIGHAKAIREGVGAPEHARAHF
jgi:hypothetical protein